MNLETKSEQSLDFTEKAQKVAIDKVTDIHNDLLLKHSFLRFGVPIFERNISTQGKIIYQDEDRLYSILNEGLISENFAKRIGRNLIRNWGDYANKSGVSLTNEHVGMDVSFHIVVSPAIRHISALREYYNINLENVRVEDLFIILVENKPYYNRSDFQKLAKNRVSPRFFKGIVILDQRLPFIYFDQDQSIIFNDTTAETAVDIAVETMLSVNLQKPNLCVPVYGLSGALYWPRQMSYEEVQKIAEERRKNSVPANHRT